MNDSNITERQHYRRDHVLAAAVFDGSIVDYAKANNLKTKVIYQSQLGSAVASSRWFNQSAEQREVAGCYSPLTVIDNF